MKFIAHEKLQIETPVDSPGGGAHRSVSVLIGPEGGFSEEEFRAALKSGYTPVYLGERRLRTETAAIVVCAMLFEAGRAK